jgi:Zn-dependent peptidase ImmA (M78 family)/DNA-binding XRE family transcriptional regulator
MEKHYNSDILKLLRKSKNLSQNEICSQLELSQGSYSKIEQGLIEPPESFVQQTASFFGVDDSFFYQNEEYYSPVNPYHRSRSTLQIGDRDRVESIANIYRIHLKKLLDAVEIVYNFVPVPVSDSLPPEEIARITRRNLRLPNGPIQNLTKLLEDNGILVITYDFKTESLDGFTIHGAKDVLPIIYFNSVFPGERIRLTLAHELGHLIMHRHIQESHDIEKEAFAFAAEFLMPAKDIIHDLRYINTMKLNVEMLLQLKRKWKVSMNALLKRSEDLNVLTKNQTKYLWMQMSKNGFRTKEPYPMHIEEPSLLKELINVYKNELHYSSNDLSVLLKLTEDAYSEFFENDKQILRVLKLFKGTMIKE